MRGTVIPIKQSERRVPGWHFLCFNIRDIPAFDTETHMKIALSFLLLALIPGISGAAETNSYHGSTEIQARVLEYLESKIRHLNIDHRIEVKPLDARLKLHKCGLPLDIFQPSGAKDIGSTSVGVRCTAPKPWLIYTSALIRQFRQVAVVTVSIERGARISERDVSLKTVETSRSRRTVVSSLDQVIGKVARRQLFAGDVVTADKLSEPKSVHRGETVIILASNPGMKIRMAGSALRDGVQGQKIPVRNTSSRRIIEGVVIAPGVVQVRF